MIHSYVDCSLDDPIVSVGYVNYRTRHGDKRLLETGTRVFNAEEDDRRIEWRSHTAEYYAAIVGVRAALDYTTEPIILNLDCHDVVDAINNGVGDYEPYFRHALFSFLPRFEDYHVQAVHRKNNEAAHEQARVGLKIGRDIHKGAV